MPLSRHVYRGAISAENARRNILRRLRARGLKPWTAAEDQKLRRLYPDYRAARRALRGRTYYALRNRVLALGIQRRRHVWSNTEIRQVRTMRGAGVPFRLIAAAMGLTIYQVKGAANLHRIKAPRKPLIKVKDPLLHSIRMRAYEMNVSLSDLCRATRSKYFLNIYNNKSLPLKTAKKALKVLDGEFSVSWSRLR